MNHYLSILLISSVLMAGCHSDSLTKEKAKQQIIEHYKANPEKLRGTTAFEPVIRGKDSGYNGKLFQLYIGGGLLQLKSSGPDSIFLYEITEKGRPWLVKETIGKNGQPVLVVKIYDYYVDEISRVKYSPDKKEAAAFFNLSIKNITPFGEGAADPDHKVYFMGIFRLVNDQWVFKRTEIDIDRLLERRRNS